jgi:AAA family ATP:ADP antiporter
MSVISEVKPEELSSWRAFLWPVYRHELKKLLPMLGIFFLFFFNYNVLRPLKDALVVTAKSSGAEAIPFIKVWVMFPGALLMTFLFTRLSNRFSRENVFYLMTTLFLTYFFVFAFFIYPYRDMLHCHVFADKMQAFLPVGCKGLVAMFRNWTFTSFYVMSELWGAIVVTMLFWGFANEVTRLSEAKRFYSLFGIAVNISGIIAGQVSIYFCSLPYNPNLLFGHDAWEQAMMSLVLLIVISGFLALALFRFMHTHVLNDELYSPTSDKVSLSKKKRPRLSMRETFSYLLKSPYLLALAVIVLSYNIVINLTEVVWKHEIHELYPNPKEFNLYMNQVTTIIGVIATFMAVFVSGSSIRKYGWTFTALLTPVVLLVTSIGFFSFFFVKEYYSIEMISAFGLNPLVMVVFFGSAQNAMSRASKYTVFDATKEMAFVPLSDESKLKGKASIDGVCSRLGKSGGALIHQGLLLIFSTINASAPFVAVFLIGVIVFWIMAARALGKQFNELSLSETKLEVTNLKEPKELSPLIA